MADRRDSENEHVWVEERLSAYIDNQLAPLERAQLERHLRGCDRCQSNLATLRWTVSLVKQAPAPALPRQFTLPVPAPKMPPRRAPAFGFGFARLATVVATLLLFAVVGIDVIAQLGGGLAASAPAPAALQNAAQPTSIALAPAQAEDHSKQPAPTSAPEQLFAVPTASPTTQALDRGGGGPKAAPTENASAKSAEATVAPPKAPALRASGTPTAAPAAGIAIAPTAVPPTAPSQPTATATTLPPTATTTALPSPTPAAQAFAQPTLAPLPPRQIETAQPVVTPIRVTEIGLFFFAVFFGALTVLLWRRK